MFRIEKKPGTGHKPYTYNIYYNGELISGNGYIYKGFFAYDDYESKNAKEYFKEKISELPDRLIVNTYDTLFFKEFELVSFERRKNKIYFAFQFFVDHNEYFFWNIMWFRPHMISNGKKMFGCESFSYFGQNGMEIVFPVEWKQGEKVNDAYKRAKKMISQTYDATIKNMVAKANTFLPKNKSGKS
jgi:hypothetical protein